MGERKTLSRGRRPSKAAVVPDELAAWFRGEGERPWSALIYPDHVLLRERWQAWKGEHPEAVPPAGHAYLEEPPPERLHGMSYAEAVRAAKACARRGAARRG